MNEPKAEVVPAPVILVEPNSLVFGQLARGQEEIQSFSVTNVGHSTLHVSDIVTASGIAFAVDPDSRTFELEPEESATVDVTFVPMGADENYGQILVLSDDPEQPEVAVDLLGLGAVPELQITPASHVFGDTFVPCGASVEIELKNVGSEALEISDLSYRSGGMLTLDDSAIRPELPLTLGPGDARAVRVSFAATREGSDTGVLDVTSNDPRGVLSADQNGEGSYVESVTDSFTEPSVPPVDVMFLIDNSCSMEQNNRDDVRNGIPPFLNELQLLSDWQMIEVTNKNGCANIGIIDPSTPNAADLLIAHAFDDVQRGPLQPINYSEKLLETAALALSKSRPGQCNDGFVRPGSLLHIIVLSDEREQSGDDYTHWLSEYERYVSAPELVKVSAVVDVNSACGDTPPTSGPGGYLEAANATGGSVLNICNANWGANFSDIASEILEGIRTYTLSESPVPESVVVTINGVPTTDVMVVDGSLTVNSPPVGDGDLVEISYGAAAECTP